MKILLISLDVFFKGGIQRYTRYQYQALTEIFGSSNVILFTLKRRDEVSFEDDIKVDFFEPYEGIFGKIHFIFKVIKSVKKIKPDLIIVNHINLAPLAFFIKKIFNINFYLNVYGIEIWSGLSKIKKLSLKKADKIIGDCKFILNYIKNNFDIDNNKLNLLYDPVDTNKFIPKEKNKELMKKYNIPDQRFIISTVGRLDRFKGHYLVIDILKYLPENIIYLIVGGGVLEGDLKRKVIHLGLEGRVIFTGRIPENELVDFYNLCDVFVLISKFDKYEGEGLPLTPIEAASCGKPIIVGDEDGSAETIEDGVNGFLISEGNKELLKDKITLLFNDFNLLREFGCNGRKRVINNFSYQLFKDNLKKIIKNI